MKMILELIGLPGSGKSVAGEQLAAALEEADYRVLLKPDVMRQLIQDQIHARCGLPLGLRRFRLVRGLTHLMYRSLINWRDVRNRLGVGGVLGALRPTQRITGLWLAEDMLLANHYRHMARNADPAAGQVFLVDEGLAHHTAAVSVWSGGRYGDISSRWLARRPCHDVRLLHVHTPLETALDRFCERGAPKSWPPQARDSRSAVRRQLERFEEAIEHSLERFRMAGARIDVLDNSGDSSQLKRRIAEFVTALENGAHADRRARSSNFPGPSPLKSQGTA
jgi:hypothetical protein